MIKRYEELLHKDWDTATEEQKQRIELLKAQVLKQQGKDKTEELEKLDKVLSEIKGVI